MSDRSQVDQLSKFTKTFGIIHQSIECFENYGQYLEITPNK
jgi:hypothetical protein